MEIEASICDNCEHVIVPRRAICPYCGPKYEMRDITISNEGKILSFTSLQQPPVGFEPPVTLALVELSGGATVLSLGSQNDEQKPKIGSTVTLSRDSLDRFVYRLLD